MNAYVEKNSGRLVRSVTADATLAFHHVNAFADGDGLAVDFIAYPDASAIDQLYLARLRVALAWLTRPSNCPASIMA